MADLQPVQRLVTRDQWVRTARASKDDPTAEISSGLCLRDAIIAMPGRAGVRKAADTVKRTVEFVVSGAARDREGDSVNPKGWDLANYKKNPVVLFGHSYYDLPVAKALTIGTTKSELVAVDEFATADMYAFADTVFRMLAGKFLNAVSAGFRPLKWLWNDKEGGYDFEEQELYEHSVVPVPAYPDALQRAMKAGIDGAPLRTWAEETLDAVAGTEGLWLPRAAVQQMLKDLTGNPALILVHKAIPTLKDVMADPDLDIDGGEAAPGADDGNPSTEDPNPAPAGGQGSTAGVACMECGAQNDHGATTCSACGKPMKAAAPGKAKDAAGDNTAANLVTCPNCGKVQAANAGPDCVSCAHSLVGGVITAPPSGTVADTGQGEDMTAGTVAEFRKMLEQQGEQIRALVARLAAPPADTRSADEIAIDKLLSEIEDEPASGGDLPSAEDIAAALKEALPGILQSKDVKDAIDAHRTKTTGRLPD